MEIDGLLPAHKSSISFEAHQIQDLLYFYYWSVTNATPPEKKPKLNYYCNTLMPQNTVEIL